MSAPELFLDGRVTLHAGDCLDVLRGMAEASVDSVVTDPPYHLVSIHKRFAKTGGADRQPGSDQYGRLSRGFMGQQWDGGDVAFRVELWEQVWRVLKPGGHLAAFSATRTYHRMACAIEDAGFEIRDKILKVESLDPIVAQFLGSLSAEQAGAFARLLEDSRFGGLAAWMYATGFPKSLSVSSAIMGPSDEFVELTPDAARWQGWGTALKPAFEPICLARKPLAERNVAANVLAHGTGAINIDACRIETSAADREAMRRVVGFDVSYSNGDAGRALSGSADGSLHRRDRAEFDATKGRWPANIVHDGSGEVVAAFPDSAAGGVSGVGGGSRPGGFGDVGAPGGDGRPCGPLYGDSGSAARFFFSAKAGRFDRLKSKHPTVKPVELMRWLVRLLTPPGGVVLDPFAGTGTTGAAAYLDGFSAVLIEREAEYRADIAARMRMVMAGPDELARALAEPAPHEDLPLFGGEDAAASRPTDRADGIEEMTP